MYWDNEYRNHGNIWGETPGPLATFASEYLRQQNQLLKELKILDLGCGYGRNAFFLAQNTKYKIFGIDNSAEAIRMANNHIPDKYKAKLNFRLVDFNEFHEEQKYDVVYVSNVYQVLTLQLRQRLREIIRSNLHSNGFVFLSTLSASDPEHSGKGIPVAGEANSFIDKKFIHLSTREELAQDFHFLFIDQLSECRYDEPRSDGSVHHHISWLLGGQKSGLC